MRLVDADELVWHKSSLVEPRDKTVSMGKPISDDEIYAYRLGWNDAIDAIMGCAPTVDAEPIKHGHWNERYDTRYHFECSICKYLHQYKDNYCPLCGAKMDAPTQKSVGKALKALEVTK